MKDRAALAIVQRAAESGQLKPGYTIVECTSGSTGTSLSSIAVALGYRCLLVTSDAFNDEKISHMRALGAEMVSISSLVAVKSPRAFALSAWRLAVRGLAPGLSCFATSEVFAPVARLINRISIRALQGLGEGRLMRFQKHMVSHKLLIIDDLVRRLTRPH